MGRHLLVAQVTLVGSEAHNDFEWRHRRYGRRIAAVVLNESENATASNFLLPSRSERPLAPPPPLANVAMGWSVIFKIVEYVFGRVDPLVANETEQKHLKRQQCLFVYFLHVSFITAPPQYKASPQTQTPFNWIKTSKNFKTKMIALTWSGMTQPPT